MDDILYLILIIAISVVSSVIESKKKKKKRQQQKPKHQPVVRTQPEEEPTFDKTFTEPVKETVYNETMTGAERLEEILSRTFDAKEAQEKTVEAQTTEREELKTDAFAAYKGMAMQEGGTASSHEKIRPTESPLHKHKSTPAPETNNIDLSDTEELKRAIIASEILNRKYAD